MSPRTCLFAIAATAVLVLGEVRAQALEVRLDRNPIHDDETVRLVVRAQTEAGGAMPDVTPLHRDFEILGRSTNTHVAITNGTRRVHTEWVIELAPRRSGRLTIGPLSVGAMRSPAIELDVLPSSSASAQAARDVFLEVDARPGELYVQSQLVWVLRIYRAAEFLDAKLSDFSPEGAVIHQLGRDTTYARTVGGRRYRVIERRFAVFPQASGRLVLPAVRLDARIAETGAASTMGHLFGEGRRVRIATRPVEVVVKPRPESAATPWLPARAVTLAAEWSEEPPRLVVGEPVTWTLRLAADGLTGEQLPPLEPPGLEGARMYPDQPSIATRAGAHTMHGERIQRIAMVPGAAGPLIIPEIRMDWWDVEADAPRTTVIPARTIDVAPAPSSPAEATRPVLAGPSTAQDSEPWLWRGVSTALALLWLVTLGALLLVVRRYRHRNPASSAPSEEAPGDIATARRRVLDACRDAAPRAARDALLDWAGLAWIESPPRDLIALAARVRGERLAEAILQLDRALWSARDRDWSGQSLAALLPDEHVPSRSRRRAAADGLPSLHPA